MNWQIFRLNKGVIVYICDSRGVRDIYDVEGPNAVAVSEPLAVLVIFFPSIIFLIRSDECSFGLSISLF